MEGGGGRETDWGRGRNVDRGKARQNDIKKAISQTKYWTSTTLSLSQSAMLI